MEGDGQPFGVANSEAFLFPASFAQQRLWFFAQLHPGSAVYHLSTVLTFDGPLDSSLPQACTSICRWWT